MKISIVVLSDPRAGEEALGRVFNALALAHEAQVRGDDVAIVFQGAGTRWPAELTRLEHPARALYDSVRPLVAGASRACATVFGAIDGVRAAGLEELADNAIAGTPGLASIRRSLAEGRTTLVF
jgi:hypothetical protein